MEVLQTDHRHDQFVAKVAQFTVLANDTADPKMTTATHFDLKFAADGDNLGTAAASVLKLLLGELRDAT